MARKTPTGEFKQLASAIKHLDLNVKKVLKDVSKILSHAHTFGDLKRRGRKKKKH